MLRFKTVFTSSSKLVIHSSEGKKHIAVVGGGMSAEREVSLVSSKGVVESLVRSGYKVTFVDMGADIATILANIKPDIVFNCLHGTYGEDGCFPGLLNIIRIPYTHSGLLASAIAFNKIKSKELFIANGIPIAAHVIVNKNDNIKSDPMPRPYVIKPMNQGSSIGVEVIFVEDEYDFAKYDFPYGEQIIVEEYIKGREMQVAVLNGKALGALELKFLKRRFYDYDTKYTDGFAEHLVPAPLTKAQNDILLNLSEKANAVIGCTGLVRAEFIYNEVSDKFIILEVNTHPGMTPLSICPEIALHQGINFDALMEEILNSARYEE